MTGIEDNIIINHYGGIGVWFSLNNRINRNFVDNTLFGHYPTGGIYLSNSNYCYITFNTLAGDYADYPNPYSDSIIDEENCVGNTIYGNILLKTNPIEESLIPGYIIHLIIIIEVISVIAISIHLKKKVIHLKEK